MMVLEEDMSFSTIRMFVSILVFGGVLIEFEDNSRIVDLENVWVQ